MSQRFPVAMQDAADAAIEAEMRWVMDFILGVRRIRGELDIAPSRADSACACRMPRPKTSLASRAMMR